MVRFSLLAVAVLASGPALADNLFPHANPYTCVREARTSGSRAQLARCLDAVSSQKEAVQALRVAGFDVDPVQARAIERAENRGDAEEARDLLRGMVR